MRLRLRTPTGVVNFCGSADSSFGELRSQLASSELPHFDLLSGFPPVKIQWSDQLPLSAALRNGDTVVVVKTDPPPSSPSHLSHPSLPTTTSALLSPAPTASPTLPPISDTSAPLSSPGGERMLCRSVPADGCCMFNALSYVLDGGSSSQTTPSHPPAPAMRQLVASAVLSGEWDEGMLGKSKEEYARWILQPQQWGGGIELAVLSKHYKSEIATLDTQTRKIHVFGQEHGFHQRVFLIFDGVHYDALARQLFHDAPAELDVTVFDVDDHTAMAQAQQVVDDAHRDCKFTDTNKFALRCLDCQCGLVGEKEAMEHARRFGHTNFAEY
ncbi:MAG: hypothetical protein SGPRY_004283 [Prymnesium sp.]